MIVERTSLPDVLIAKPRLFTDSRGLFFESYTARRYAEAGIQANFVQDNVSVSHQHTLRGLHLQHPRGQAKLFHVLEGTILDVAVDVRVGSPTFGKHVAVQLTAENHLQLFVPAGFAHGFCVLSDRAVMSYKCSEYYDQPSELCVRWDDPEIGIEWPVSSPLLSEKDAAAPLLREIDPRKLPRYSGPSHG